MTLTFEKPRCMAYDRHSVDARCEYEAYAASVGYCVECRPSHPDDVHTLVVTQYGDAHPRCYDGYTREWLGGVDLGSKNGVSIDPGSVHGGVHERAPRLPDTVALAAPWGASAALG